MGITYNFSCDKCGCKEYLEAENDYEKVLICKNCANGYVVEQKKLELNPTPLNARSVETLIFQKSQTLKR